MEINFQSQLQTVVVCAIVHKTYTLGPAKTYKMGLS